jgi:hypothetical protein
MNLTLVVIAAVFTVSVTPALAQVGYSFDAKGNCHDPHGKFAKKALCAKPPVHCRDTHGRYAKCGMPGTHPA